MCVHPQVICVHRFGSRNLYLEPCFFSPVVVLELINYYVFAFVNFDSWGYI